MRSLIFSIYMVISVVVYSFVVMASIILPMRTRHWLVRLYLANNLWMLKKICLIDYKVEGLDNIPKDRNGIVISNHQSTWETFYIPLKFHQPAAIVKKELLHTPFFGWAMRVAEPIAIDRKDKSSAMQQIIKKGKVALDKGRWIMMFPEGTRIPYGTSAPFKMGAARLAAATGYPIVPVAHNAGKFWARRRFIKQPGTVHMVIGPPVETSGRSAEDIHQEAVSWIQSTMQQLKSDE